MIGHRFIRGTCLLFGALWLTGCSGPTEAPPESVSLVPDVGAVDQAPAPTADARGVAPAAGSPHAIAPGAVDVVTTTEVATGTLLSATDTAATGPDVEVAIAEPIGAITETLTYVDPTIGYAIDYPASWFIEATPGSIVMLTSFSLADGRRSGLGEGDAKLDIIPDLDQGISSLEQLTLQAEQSGQVLSEQDVLLSGNIPAVLVRLDSAARGGGTAALVAVINGRGLRLHGYGDLTLFEAIARSLRAAE